MSAPEIGQRATNGAEHAPNLPFERQKILSSENQSTTAVSTVVVQTFLSWPKAQLVNQPLD